MWHHAGRVTKKCNSFQDFIACANHLVEHGYAHPQKLAAWGISAGGLLVGATINMFPSLFRAAILEVRLGGKKNTTFCAGLDYLESIRSALNLFKRLLRGLHGCFSLFYSSSSEYP